MLKIIEWWICWFLFDKIPNKWTTVEMNNTIRGRIGKWVIRGFDDYVKWVIRRYN